MKTTFSAPPSMILAGELSYQYGRPLLLCAVKERDEIHHGGTQDLSYVKLVSQEVVEYCKRKNIDYLYKTTSYHCIDSQTVFDNVFSKLVCLVSFLYQAYTSQDPTRGVVNEIVFTIGKKTKQDVSDVRSSLSVYGGLILYRREFEFLRYITQLKIHVPYTIEKNMYCISLPKHLLSMKILNKAVTEQYGKESKKVESTFLEIEKATKRMIVAFMKEDLNFFIGALNYAQSQLLAFDVVNVKVQTLHQAIIAQGGGAKIIQNNFADDTCSFITVIEEKNLKNLQKKFEFQYKKVSLSKHGLIANGGQIK